MLLAGEIAAFPEYNPRAYQRLCGESFVDESYDFEFLAEDVAIELNEICDETHPGGSFLPQPVPMCVRAGGSTRPDAKRPRWPY